MCVCGRVENERLAIHISIHPSIAGDEFGGRVEGVQQGC